MNAADFRILAAEVGVRPGTPSHLFGATIARATVSPPRNTQRPSVLVGAMRRGDIVAISRGTGWSVDELLWYAKGVSDALYEPLAVKVNNGNRLPLRSTALLGVHDDFVEVAGASRDSWARGVVLEAWASLGLAKPNLATLQAVQSIGRLEGYYGLATKPEGWAGSWNWGAVQCKHGAPCGDDCFAAVDTHADGSRYTWCFKRYPSAVAGATDLIRLVTTKRPSVAKLLPSGNLTAIAAEMRATHYFEAPADVYAGGLYRNAQQIADAIGEPLRVSLGGNKPAKPKGAQFGAAALWGLGAALTAITWSQRGH